VAMLSLDSDSGTLDATLEHNGRTDVLAITP
jgi:hypothetical protein